MIIKTTIAGAVFTAAAFIFTLALASGVRAQTPLTVPLCRAELARLYQQIGRCSDDACRHQIQLAIVRHNARCG